MMTVKQPSTMVPPCAVLSPMRAAGRPPINTLGAPMTMVSGGPTQVTMLLTRAAGKPPINTVGAPGATIGPPTCGTTPVTIGHTCMSVRRAAGGMANSVARWRDPAMVRQFGARSQPRRMPGLRGRAAHRHRIDLQGRLAHAHRHALAVLAAHTHTLVQR